MNKKQNFSRKRNRKIIFNLKNVFKKIKSITNIYIYLFKYTPNNTLSLPLFTFLISKKSR